MAQIIPKLNLNKTPSTIESNSLVFAKNIRLDVDGSIHRDYGIFPMSIHKGKYTNNMVNYKTIINRIISDIRFDIDNTNNSEDYVILVYERLLWISGDKIKNDNGEVIASRGVNKIVGVITNSNEFYIFINGSCLKGDDVENDVTEIYNFIIRYDEKDDRFYPCNCNWNWSGGTITGCVVNNLLGEKILNIGENHAAVSVPLKCINLNVSNIKDDERIYTQTSNIPITNLNYIGTFNYVIPNGVYQFFVRYKIRDNFYTDWFPASKELFAGNKNITNTSFGTVKFVNTHRDSDNSFKFAVEHLFADQEYNYQSFQIGFIISHDDAIMARAWKHFDFTVSSINFDYNAKDAYEIEVIDLLKNAYQLYDVGNITSFKNKLYISNYKETDFNENHQDLANQIGIDIISKVSSSGYDGYPIIPGPDEKKKPIAGLIIDGQEFTFSGKDGIIDKLLHADNYLDESVRDAVYDAVGENTKGSTKCGAKQWGIRIDGTKTSLASAMSQFESKFDKTYYSNFIFDSTITKIKADDTYIELTSDKELLLNRTLSAIYDKLRYLNSNCIFVNANGLEDYKADIEITRPCSYVRSVWVSGGVSGGNHGQPIEEEEGVPPEVHAETEEETITRPGDIENSNGHYEYQQINSSYTQKITIRLYGDRSKYDSVDSSLLLRYTTLIPYQKYKFYIHYVKQNGEISNGYYCDGDNAGIKEVPFKDTVDAIIYPKFTNIKLPEGYVACFFSILHVENNVATVFNIDNSYDYGEASCMDINVGLMAGSDNITIKQGTREITDGNTIEVKTDTAKYYYSSDSSNIRCFGGDGIIQFDKSSGITGGGEGNIVGSKVAYIVNDYTVSDAEDTQLTKCTPFINPNTLSTEENINMYSSFDDMNLLGYICAINPLDRTRTINYYTDGSSVYLKKGIEYANEDSGEYFQLVELKNHLLDADTPSEKITALYILDTNVKYVYSNYNLNYLELSDEPTEVYKTYYNNRSEESTDKTVSTGSIVLRLFKSLMMSSIYMLPTMYKLYTKKTYSMYRRNEITEFNNTIRSSKLEGDESSINIYKFEPNDYYNIPTNRGLIVNLISVGDAILVHTEDSMFRFSGSNTLQSSDGEIQPAENNVFDTGVSEVFGSDFGFAGLQYKTDHIVTENGYIFFDRDSRIVYLYSGQGQIIKISDSIEKLFRSKNIENIRFANDYYNNRFFMSILFFESYTTIINGRPEVRQKYYPVTLSFNVSSNVKAFVSLHDFYYNYAFNTKTKCYFLTEDNKDICDISKQYKACYTKLELSNDKLYVQKRERIYMIFATSDVSSPTLVGYNLYSYASIADIINNENYENIKTLNAINWCGYKVEEEFKDIDQDDDSTLNMVEESNYNIPCKYIRVYTDTCMSPLCDCTERSNDKNISASSYYKYPFYNQGVWTFNYFRNILNSKNNKIRYSGDNNSLIEGKYFVVRFVFDSDFKLETLYLNYNVK